ncbi:MAG: zf-HC2 domain-containing protein [Clostridiales bacterium]|nr:zf-HC2 domain-containing protein [Clostridiales bacterium]
MKCNEARRMVVPFVKKELSERDTERFLAHAETCPDCMDELDIYFTVYHALDAMDSGERHEYDFKKMLDEEIRTSRRAIRKRKVLNAARFVLLFAAELMLILCIFVGVRMKQGTVGNSVFERALLRLHIEKMDAAQEGLSESETESETEQTEETETERNSTTAETSDAEAEPAAMDAAGETTAGATGGDR